MNSKHVPKTIVAQLKQNSELELFIILRSERVFYVINTGSIKSYKLWWDAITNAIPWHRDKSLAPVPVSSTPPVSRSTSGVPNFYRPVSD